MRILFNFLPDHTYRLALYNFSMLFLHKQSFVVLFVHKFIELVYSGGGKRPLNKKGIYWFVVLQLWYSCIYRYKGRQHNVLPLLAPEHSDPIGLDQVEIVVNPILNRLVFVLILFWTIIVLLLWNQDWSV